MKTAAILFAICWPALIAMGADHQLVYQSIILVTANGYGSRALVPFLESPEGKGKRLWESLVEPIYAKTENSSDRTDINLFSRCGIKITATDSRNEAALLKISLVNFKIPSSINVKRPEIISALLDCLIYTAGSAQKPRPEVTFFAKDEDQEITTKAVESYWRTGDDVVDPEKARRLVKEITQNARLEEIAKAGEGKILSDTKLADVSNEEGGRIVIRDLRLPKFVFAPQASHNNEHFYRFEYYLNGILQSCESYGSARDPGVVKVEWVDGKKCNISLANGSMQMTFQIDAPAHWSLGIGID